MASVETQPQLDVDLDGAAVAGALQRFRHQHELRLARTGARLPPRQRAALAALPMLYHRNHPALPGYAGAEVPCGIAGLRPSREQVSALRQVSRSYAEPRLPPPIADLQAMFIMGSGGTVGHGRGSDIDLWVCCDTLLHSSLWPKVRLIDQWAEELGLELHTFLVDPKMLRNRQQLPGTRTPALLLDEFYRSGALLAGRYPLWWLIPATDAAEYAAVADRLIRRRFVRPDDVVDFGPVPRFPAGQLAQAAITELDRALVTPHKSLLKLQLMEAYAAAPELGSVSSAYKARIHAGETDPLSLDPYLLLYDHVARYLEGAGRADELPFVRRLLIAKTAENAGSGNGATPLADRFAAWGFGPTDVARFLDVSAWSMSARMAEHRRIVAALERGIALVEELVARGAGGEPAGGEPGDGRQLQWLNETRLRHLAFAVARIAPASPADGSAGRQPITVLHPALVDRRKPARVHLRRGAHGWTVDDGAATVGRFPRLAGAAVWAERNGAELVPEPAGPELMRNLAQIRQALGEHSGGIRVLINAEPDMPRPGPRDVGGIPQTGTASVTTLLSRNNDPLDFSGFHRLLLESLDLVEQDAAGHWHLTALVDPAALLEGLGCLLGEDAGAVGWHAMGGHGRFLVAERLTQLHKLTSRTLAVPGAVFVLPFGPDTATLRRGAGSVEARRHPSLAALNEYLRQVPASALGIDPVSQRLRGMRRAG